MSKIVKKAYINIVGTSQGWSSSKLINIHILTNHVLLTKLCVLTFVVIIRYFYIFFTIMKSNLLVHLHHYWIVFYDANIFQGIFITTLCYSLVSLIHTFCIFAESKLLLELLIFVHFTSHTSNHLPNSIGSVELLNICAS